MRRSQAGAGPHWSAHPGGVGIRHPCRQCCGRLTTTAKGAIPAMPDSAAIQVCVQAMGAVLLTPDTFRILFLPVEYLCPGAVPLHMLIWRVPNYAIKGSCQLL